MQDAQDDRSQICLNYVTKGLMYLLTLVVDFIVAFYTMFVRYIYIYIYIYVLQKQNKINKT